MTPLLSPRRNSRAVLWGLVAFGVSASAACAGAVAALLPNAGVVAQGTQLAGRVVDGDPADIASELANTALDRTLTFTVDGHALLTTTARALGASADTETAVRQAWSVGREGSLFARAVDALHARNRGQTVSLRFAVPVEATAQALAEHKDHYDTRPRDARLDVASNSVSPHEEGHYLDVYGVVDALGEWLNGVGRGEPLPTVVELSAPQIRLTPEVTSDDARAIDTSAVVARYQTHFADAGGQAGRGSNVALAASRVNGLVLSPGRTVSFNAAVGPRSTDAGFATAPEIYKGEMREGVGGGTCQVASTLHAAAYLGGLTIAQRANHSRPSGYIPVGLDATVVYPDVDLRIENTLPFAVVVDARTDHGLLTVELRGHEKPAVVSYRVETIGVSKYRRKIERVGNLPPNEFRKKQAGRRGITVRKTRTIKPLGGEPREEVSVDVYPPVVEIYQLGPSTDVSVLPPLPEADAIGDGPAVARNE